MEKRKFFEKEKSKSDKKVIEIRRVAKVRVGDKLLGFSALVVAGDRKGNVGISLGKGRDAQVAVNKGGATAERKMVRIEMSGTTVPHEVHYKYGAAIVMIKPAPVGTGIIAGGAVRMVLEVAGIKDVVAKQIANGGPINNGYCTYWALRSLRAVKKPMKNVKNKEVKEVEKPSESKE